MKGKVVRYIPVKALQGKGVCPARVRDGDILAIGSGGNYALSAGKALLENTDLPAEAVAKKALLIASSICVFTNDHITVEVIGRE